jgi:hypothetical protein
MTGDTGNWLLRKLRGLYERSAAPDLVLPKPAPRYRLSKDYRPKPPAIPVEAPPGVSKSEWREAARNVAFGSVPSTIAAGSDTPSDWTMRRNGFA